MSIASGDGCTGRGCCKGGFEVFINSGQVRGTRWHRQRHAISLCCQCPACGMTHPLSEHHRTLSPLYGGRRTSVTESTENGENGEFRLFSSAKASSRSGPAPRASPAQ